jgi:REP element-mobilizing transposase RayT
MMRHRMDQAPYVLDRDRRVAVLYALREVCAHRSWSLLAAHVRSNHVHVVVEADVPPDKVMNAFKSYASRRLNSLGIDEPGRKRWARHGSTRWLWKDEDVQESIRDVVSGQGEPMEVYLADLL